MSHPFQENDKQLIYENRVSLGLRIFIILIGLGLLIFTGITLLNQAENQFSGSPSIIIVFIVSGLFFVAVAGIFLIILGIFYLHLGNRIIFDQDKQIMTQIHYGTMWEVRIEVYDFGDVYHINMLPADLNPNTVYNVMLHTHQTVIHLGPFSDSQTAETWTKKVKQVMKRD